MRVAFNVIGCIPDVSLQNRGRVDESEFFVELFNVVLVHAAGIALELGKCVAFGEEVIHGVVRPPGEIFQTVTEAYL